MKSGKSGGKVFRDPVHQLIRIAPEDRYILDLIDTPEFQRLRRIRQLGVSSLTFHGAEHSRFSHSLGVFNIAQRIIQSLQLRYGPKSDVYQTRTQYAKIIKAAALLHDVGHAPFSHMLERAFAGTHHEQRTVELICGKQSGLNKALCENQIKPEDVASVVRKDFPVKLVVDIVSSQLDADRMDYLLRDSHCTGVSYGEFDLEWLLHAMCVGRVADGHGSSKSSPKLCLDKRKGIYAAERFVAARLHMYQQVYMHRVTRGFEVLMLNLFTAAAHLAKRQKLPAETPPLVNNYFSKSGKLDLSNFLQFDESQVVAALHVWSHSKGNAYKTIRRLSAAFLSRRRLYGSINLTGSAAEMLKLGEELGHLPKESDGVTQAYGIDTVSDTPYKGMVYRARGDASPEEIINDSILVADPENPESVKPVETASRLLQNMDAEQFVVTRLYFDRERTKMVESIIRKLGIKMEN